MPEISIHNMELHDSIQLCNGEILRVPGGWIYRQECENGTGGYDMTSCFVPFNGEFLPDQEDQF